MPVCLIDAAAGIQLDAKQKLVERVSAALDQAYHLDDCRVFIREHQRESVGQDRRVPAEAIKPVCSLEVPPRLSIDRKRKMMAEITEAVALAWQVERADVLVLLREYPFENVAANGLLQAENPDFPESLKAAR